MYYQNYHKHTSYSNGGNFKDSPITHKDYFEAMLPLAEKGIPQIYSAFEHGWQSPYGRIYNDLEAFNKEHKKDNPGYKDIVMTIGLEGYWVLDHSEKDKTNNHICLIAKNENGRKALNFYNAMTFITQEQIDNGNAKRFFNYEGNTPYTYFKNRWDIDLLLKLPKDDVLVTTACVGFYGYAKGENETQLDFTKTDEVIRILNNHFTSFYLEVQANNTDFQIKVNQHLVELHNELNIPLISATDSHYIYPGQKEDREYMQKSQNNGKLPYSDEDENYMDFPSCEELIKRYKVQNVLTDDLIKEAIENTNVMLNYAVTLDRSLKVPSLPQLKDKSQTEKNKFLWNLLMMELKKQAHDLNKNKIKEYKEAIKKEFNEIVKCNMADYFIDDYFIVKKGLKNGGLLTKTGRGSGCGEFINKLLGLTSIDRINAPVELYPERFLTATRILESKTPPDIDNNISEREPFIEAQRQILGNRSSFDLLAVGTLKYKSAFKMFARANNLEPNIQNDITKQIDIYEKAVKHAEDDEEISIYDYIDEKYHKLVDGCQKYRGIVDNLKSHPCGTVLYDGDVISDIGVILVKSESTKRECWVCLQESITIDSFGLVKNDWLVVDSIGLINDVYKLLGKTQPSINELSKLVENDNPTWDIYAKGQTMLINQVEKQKSKEKAMLFKPKNIYELTQFVAGIRPSFSSMLKTFLNRTHFEYSIPSLDKLLQDEFCDSSFILYQEQLMKVLDYAGFPLSETYTIIKAISKKKTHVIMDAKNKFIPNFAKHIIDNREAETETEAINTSKAVWKIIEDSAAYGFNCLSGNTKLYRQKNNTKFSPTIAEMYRIKNDKDYAKKTGHYSLYQKYNSQGYGKVLSLKDNRLYENQIIDIYKKGIKMTYEITTDDGSKVYATLDHKFPTIQGDKTVKQLKVGDNLYKLDRYEKNKNTYTLTKNGSQNFKKGHCGFIKLENSATNNYHSFRNNCINERKSYADCGTNFSEDLRFEVHHIDFNRKNNNIMNYVWLCSSCHKKRHYNHGRIKKFEKGLLTKLVKIISIKPYKEEEVYDISVSENVSHTFTLDNGIVTHNCSHAYSMALDSVQLAYLKAHYPYEFYQACLQRYTRKNDKNKVIDIKQEMSKFTNIKVENVLFGKPCTKYTVDKEHHLITQDISGVKGIQKIAGNILDSLIGKKYDKFVDIYVDLKERGLNKTTIATLIAIDCFREYGSILKLQKLFLFLEEFRGQKGFKKTIKKAGKSVDIYKPYFDIIARYSKETTAQYKVNDVMGMLREIESNIPNNSTPILLKASLENKYLGFTTLTDKNLSDNLYLVQDIETNKWGTHFATLYQLNSGKTEAYRVNKEIYNNLPLINSDVIYGMFSNFKGKITLNCYNIKVRVEKAKKEK